MISAILLCAGESKRLGGPKALLTIDSKTFVRNAIEQIFKSGVEELILVTGAYQKEVEIEVHKYFDPLIRLAKIKLIHNQEYKAGMMSSIQKGVKSIAPEASAFFIALVDLPFVSHADYQNLIKEFKKTEKKLVRGRFKGQATHPVLISTDLKKEILVAPVDDKGCAFLFKKYPAEISWHEVDSERGMLDIDSMKDYRAHIAV